MGSVGVDEARTLLAKREAVIVDVRSEKEWGEGHVPGSIHAPEGEVPELPDDRRVLIMDADGSGSTELQGVDDADVVEGGMAKWRAQGLALQPTGDAAEPHEDPPDEPLEKRIAAG